MAVILEELQEGEMSTIGPVYPAHIVVRPARLQEGRWCGFSLRARKPGQNPENESGPGQRVPSEAPELTRA